MRSRAQIIPALSVFHLCLSVAKNFRRNFTRAIAKSGRGLPHSKTLTRGSRMAKTQSVWECSSPLELGQDALWYRQRDLPKTNGPSFPKSMFHLCLSVAKNFRRNFTRAIAKSGRGLPHSKTLTRGSRMAKTQSVWECSSPLELGQDALWYRQRDLPKTNGPSFPKSMFHLCPAVASHHGFTVTWSNNVEFSTALLCAVSARPMERFLFSTLVTLPAVIQFVPSAET